MIDTNLNGMLPDLKWGDIIHGRRLMTSWSCGESMVESTILCIVPSGCDWMASSKSRNCEGVTNRWRVRKRTSVACDMPYIYQRFSTGVQQDMSRGAAREFNQKSIFLSIMILTSICWKQDIWDIHDQTYMTFCMVLGSEVPAYILLSYVGFF